MARYFEHSAHYPKTVDVVRAALASAQYWTDRLAAIGGSGAELSGPHDAGGTVTVDLRQTVSAKHLPSLVAKIRPGDLVIRRTESTGPVSDGTVQGRFSATIEGAPATISGKSVIEPDGDGCVVRLDGSAEVGIPLLGGKVEAVIVDQLHRLFEMEDDFTGKWLTGQH